MVVRACGLSRIEWCLFDLSRFFQIVVMYNFECPKLCLEHIFVHPHDSTKLNMKYKRLGHQSLRELFPVLNISSSNSWLCLFFFGRVWQFCVFSLGAARRCLASFCIAFVVRLDTLLGIGLLGSVFVFSTTWVIVPLDIVGARSHL